VDWKGLAYIGGIPFGAFVLDLWMRRLIKADRLTLLEYCYGPDLGLTGLTTGIAILPEIRNPDLVTVVLVLFLSLFCWIGSMVLHQAYEPRLESHQRVARWLARSMLLGTANVLGAVGLAIVLYLMWPPS
jgi:hypothetical protein